MKSHTHFFLNSSYWLATIIKFLDLTHNGIPALTKKIEKLAYLY